jgi:hypothetical protein
MDREITFLNGGIDDKVYMEQLERFVINRQEKKVRKFVKLLYGLKQAPK